jgi:hypothetical protein
MEAKIYAIDECTKYIQHLSHILYNLHLYHEFLNDNTPILIMIDNEAAVKWCHNMTTKGLQHIQMMSSANKFNWD